MKRASDIFLTGVAMVLLSPVMGVIAALLRARHGSPVLFRQTRVGLHGEQFSLHKFRSMEERPGPLVTAGVDPRVHSMGRILRSTKLDELPQLWDVFRGKMSLVGPRPEVAEFVAYWPEEHRDVILSVRPGITDPASIKFRRESEILAQYDDPKNAYITVVLPEKCRIYVEYVRDASLRRDLKIIFQTFRAIVRGPESLHD